MMLPEERRSEVANLINERHGCSVEDLAAALDVSEATIRRDLRELEESNLVRRTHGGALPVVDQPRGYDQRAVRNREGKEAIAERAAAEVHKDQIVYFDSGTTTMPIVDYISDDLDVTGVTNGAVNALKLVESEFQVYLVGGMFWSDDNGLAGSWAEERIENMNFDLLFLSAGGVDSEGLTTRNPRQSGVRRRMIDSSRRVVLVADRNKFNEDHFVKFADPGDVDVLMTDGTVPEEIRESFEAEDVDIVENLGDR
jgi:DeoR family fructose operon transcriptional repressor